MGMPLFTKLILGGSVTLALVIGELVLSHYTHSISLLVVTNQSMYNLLTLGVSASAIAVSTDTLKYYVAKPLITIYWKEGKYNDFKSKSSSKMGF